jgi:Mg-chelatase subunit ChlI
VLSHRLLDKSQKHLSHWLQVRAMVDLLPEMDVVPGDAFNSSPTDPELMGPDVRARYHAGEQLPTGKAKTPLVRRPWSVEHSTTVCKSS